MRNSSRWLFILTIVLVAVTVLIARQQKLGLDPDFETVVLPTSTPDFASISDVNEKKQAFFDFLGPQIQLQNQLILKERERLISIEKSFRTESLSSNDVEYIRKLGERYYSSIPTEGVTQDWLNEMLIKVNVLPKALVLTQAANESAWGTSRFAIQANNYFGQWCYKAGCGLVPLKRQEGATHEVAKFDSVTKSVHGYFMNVNRNRAYAALRSIRSDLATNGKDLTSVDTAMALTQGLLSYSERGQDYINDLQTMIRANNKFWID
ncbi:glucosaminidase domain-containing protein [Vibrio algarum]|uniref:Glucosaminidase domain-containing protein n=1 Tax=Vibrio algarum TaxID=3020714 RepID=A0ABT4YQW6_9VIBR|nr:glucosaminidase domain-containing protein [Vibrio sp. KJ40-1]MDB1123880.1 glucosaminidase domain-containing protein [Vibrio sp. KJ40-1]